MQASFYRVDPRMIPPVVVAMVCAAVLLVMEGLTNRGMILLLVLAPFFYLGIEILARKIRVDDQGITVFKFLRSVHLEWSDIDSLDAIQTGSKLFLIIQSEESRPVLITNTISHFKELGQRLLEAVPPGKVVAACRDSVLNPPVKHGPLIQAWIVCLVFLAMRLPERPASTSTAVESA